MRTELQADTSVESRESENGAWVGGVEKTRAASKAV